MAAACWRELTLSVTGGGEVTTPNDTILWMICYQVREIRPGTKLQTAFQTRCHVRSQKGGKLSTNHSVRGEGRKRKESLIERRGNGKGRRKKEKEKEGEGGREG